MFSARGSNFTEYAGEHFDGRAVLNGTIAMVRNVDAYRACLRAREWEEQKRSRVATQRGQNDHTFTVSLWQWHCPWRQGLG